MSSKRTNRIPYIGSAMLCAFATGLLFTWSYFREPLNELFPTWTSADLSTMFSFHNTILCGAQIICGAFARKISARVRMIASSVLIGLGLTQFSFIPVDDPSTAFVLAFIGFSVIAAIGVAIGFTTWAGTFIMWIPERPGLISGLMLMLFGFTPLVYGAIASAIIPAIGILATIRTLGLLSTVLMLVCTPFVRPPKQSDCLPPPRVIEANKNDVSYTAVQMLKTPIFWLMFIFNVVMRAAGLIFADHASGIALSFGVSALFGVLYSPANGIASFVSGNLVDMIGSAKTMRVFSGLLMLACVLLFFASWTLLPVFALIGIVLCGFSYGGNSAANATSVRLFFGSEYYTFNYTLAMLSIFFASLICYVGGLVVDAAGGSYYGIYTLTLGLGAVGFVCTFLLAVCVKRREKV
ncbi:MAG: MFS transporter [Oscillospiraceae bacterium]|nr:MFS transporter [Oscillospiraceae bacterium]